MPSGASRDSSACSTSTVACASESARWLGVTVAWNRAASVESLWFGASSRVTTRRASRTVSTTLLPGQACPVRAAAALRNPMSNGALCATSTAPRENSRKLGSTSSMGGAPMSIVVVMPVSTWMNGGTGPPGSTSVWNSPSTSPPRTLTAPISVIAQSAGVPPVVSRSTTTNVDVRQRRAEVVQARLVRACRRRPGSRPPRRGAGGGRTTWRRTLPTVTDTPGLPVARRQPVRRTGDARGPSGRVTPPPRVLGMTRRRPRGRHGVRRPVRRPPAVRSALVAGRRPTRSAPLEPVEVPASLRAVHRFAPRRRATAGAGPLWSALCRTTRFRSSVARVWAQANPELAAEVAADDRTRRAVVAGGGGCLAAGVAELARACVPAARRPRRTTPTPRSCGRALRARAGRGRPAARRRCAAAARTRERRQDAAGDAAARAASAALGRRPRAQRGSARRPRRPGRVLDAAELRAVACRRGPAAGARRAARVARPSARPRAPSCAPPASSPTRGSGCCWTRSSTPRAACAPSWPCRRRRTCPPTSSARPTSAPRVAARLARAVGRRPRPARRAAPPAVGAPARRRLQRLQDGLRRPDAGRAASPPRRRARRRRRPHRRRGDVLLRRAGGRRARTGGYARGVRVLFAVGEIADDLIRRLVHAEPPGRVLVVVTSDQEVVAGRRGGRRLGGAVEHARRAAPAPLTGRLSVVVASVRRMIIDCDTCTARGAACADCVVTFLTIPVRAPAAGRRAGAGTTQGRSSSTPPSSTPSACSRRPGSCRPCGW